MERLDGARRVQRWRLSMKSLLCSICNVMPVRSRKVPVWENMDRDILVKIFEKLSVIDVTMGASRVCISWFLVSHQKSLWKTIDLSLLQTFGVNHPQLRKLQLTDVEINNNICYPRKILTEITKFSSTVPTSLFFNSWVEDEDLIMAAERMPNIQTLVLPRWCSLSGNSCRFVFSRWRNLHTLIISPAYNVKHRINFKLVGENCNNLTNLKFTGDFDEYLGMEIVRYIPKLKRLSMRCCVIYNTREVSRFITYLRNLTVLNLSHCIFKEKITDPIFGMALEDSILKTFTQKIDTFIMCPKAGCCICKDPYRMAFGFAFFEKHWRNDEIKELEF